MHTTMQRAVGLLLLACLAVPFLNARAGQPDAVRTDENLQWLVARHDLRYALQVNRPAVTNCGHAAEPTGVEQE